MFKSGQTVTVWKQAFFIICKSDGRKVTLDAYEAEGGKQLRSINIQDANVYIDSSKSQDFKIQIAPVHDRKYNEKNKFKVAAKDRQDQNRWIHAIQCASRGTPVYEDLNSNFKNEKDPQKDDQGGPPRAPPVPVRRESMALELRKSPGKGQNMKSYNMSQATNTILNNYKHNLTEEEKIEVEMLCNLTDQYVTIVKSTMVDLAPKAVNYMLITEVNKDINDDLIAGALEEGGTETFMAISPERQTRINALIKTVETLKTTHEQLLALRKKSKF